MLSRSRRTNEPLPLHRRRARPLPHEAVRGVLASGDHAWQTGPQWAVNQQMSAWKTALGKAFGVHQRRYGTRRRQVAQRQHGRGVGRQRLRPASRRRRGLHALQPKAYTPRTTDAAHGLRCAPNRLLDQPKPTRATQV